MSPFWTELYDGDTYLYFGGELILKVRKWHKGVRQVSLFNPGWLPEHMIERRANWFMAIPLETMAKTENDSPA